MTNGNTRAVLIKESGMDRVSTPEYMMESGSRVLCGPGPHSPTDSSEDSVEVKVEAIAGRSKRKLLEPRRFNDISQSTGPLKKRICLRAEESAPFRPWSASSPSPVDTHKMFVSPITRISSSSAHSTPSPPEIANCITYSPPSEPMRQSYFRPPSPVRPTSPQPMDLIKKPKIKEEPPEPLRIPIHPSPTDSVLEMETALSTSMQSFPKLEEPQQLQQHHHQQEHQVFQKKEQRNYKNMTRERRIEANARERTRVHTISAAFDTLRRTVPAYSHSQKLSKLSVLRIACSYIMTLSNILEGSPDVAESVETVSRTIQKEGKLRKKKDEE